MRTTQIFAQRMFAPAPVRAGKRLDGLAEC